MNTHLLPWPKVTCAEIEVPLGVNSEAIAHMLDCHEAIADDCGGLVHVNINAHDHPNRKLLELDMIGNGADPEKISITADLSHTVANTLHGLPELIVVNLCPSTAARIIAKVEEMIDEGELEPGKPYLIGEVLVQVEPVDFQKLQSFDGAYESFIAMQILMKQRGYEPQWMQIVYADSHYRFPWEPGADKEFYQPVPARPFKYSGYGEGRA